MRILPILVAVVCIAPLVQAGPELPVKLTAAIQSDPGTHPHGDASDREDAPTPLQIAGKTTGWMRGALVVLDDPRDVYSIFMSGSTEITFVVDPDLVDLDIRLELRSPNPTDPPLVADAQGIGQAEAISTADQGNPSGGIWVLSVILKDVPDPADELLPDLPPVGPNVRAAVAKPSLYADHAVGVDLRTYSLNATCHPICMPG